MPIEVARIPIDGLSCHECDCGACLGAAVAAIKEINGVVHVGIDRRRLIIHVRYDEAETDPAVFRDAVVSSGLGIAGPEG
jgi:copper chaperone CopZ